MYRDIMQTYNGCYGQPCIFTSYNNLKICSGTLGQYPKVYMTKTQVNPLDLSSSLHDMVSATYETDDFIGLGFQAGTFSPFPHTNFLPVPDRMPMAK